MAAATHYQVLEVSPDAKLIDIKKAYRRLALKHHPDRNNGSAESTEKFKEISEAFTVLSDATSRRDYDLSLKRPSTSISTAASPNYDAAQHTRERDPFKQFDDLFRNDPFFHEAFRDMDDAFARRFDNAKDQNRNGSSAQNDTVGPLFFCGAGADKPKQTWGQWILNKLGIELTVTSYSHGADGSMTASNFTSKPTGTYTNKQSRKYVDKNGRQVSIIEMEKDGNKITDKFIEGKLVERRVNGSVEPAQHELAH
ncbi:hypothetical protein ACHAXT_001160 [Thalassiosira profunda]